MTITALEPNRLVTYTSTQHGRPDARHERHFQPDGDGFVYRLVVEYEPCSGIMGMVDSSAYSTSTRGITRFLGDNSSVAGWTEHL